jgi:hypothetical protein
VLEHLLAGGLVQVREPLLRSMLTATGWPLLSTSTRNSTVPCSWLRSAGIG